MRPPCPSLWPDASALPPVLAGFFKPPLSLLTDSPRVAGDSRGNGDALLIPMFSFSRFSFDVDFFLDSSPVESGDGEVQRPLSFRLYA